MFEMKRKQHYNEFAAVKLARQLMEDDDESEEEMEVSSSKVDEDESCAMSSNHREIDKTC